MVEVGLYMHMYLSKLTNCTPKIFVSLYINFTSEEKTTKYLTLISDVHAELFRRSMLMSVKTQKFIQVNLKIKLALLSNS